MTRLAITGHRGLSPGIAAMVDHDLRAQLARYADGLVGISCLADGADQLFARAVIELGGKLEVVVPAERYRDGLPEDAHDAYDELISHAAAVHRLNHLESTPESHMDASIQMLRRADVLLAVWDGLPARGFGGTADVVSRARQAGVPVTVIWPEGAHRD